MDLARPPGHVSRQVTNPSTAPKPLDIDGKPVSPEAPLTPRAASHALEINNAPIGPAAAQAVVQQQHAPVATAAAPNRLLNMHPGLLGRIAGFIPASDVENLTKALPEKRRELIADPHLTQLIAAQQPDAPWRVETQKAIASLEEKIRGLQASLPPINNSWDNVDETPELLECSQQLFVLKRQLEAGEGVVAAEAERFGGTAASMDAAIQAEYAIQEFADEFLSVLTVNPVAPETRMANALKVAVDVAPHMQVLISRGQGTDVDWKMDELSLEDHRKIETTISEMLAHENAPEAVKQFLKDIQLQIIATKAAMAALKTASEHIVRLLLTTSEGDVKTRAQTAHGVFAALMAQHGPRLNRNARSTQDLMSLEFLKTEVRTPEQLAAVRTALQPFNSAVASQEVMWFVNKIRWVLNLKPA